MSSVDQKPVALNVIPFAAIDWENVDSTQHPGQVGHAIWKTTHAGTTRVRVVEYSPGYVADHWCERGHILLVLEGKLLTELKDGRTFTLTKGMSYQVSNGAEPHRSSTQTGAKLFIVD